jgi:hypothetical protein
VEISEAAPKFNAEAVEMLSLPPIARLDPAKMLVGVL